MPELNLDLNYFDHPKTRRLIGLLGNGAEVLPIRLWCHTGKVHAETGRLTGYSTQEIETIVVWWGRKGEAVDALLKVGFLEKTNDGFQVHAWREYQGHLIAYKLRAQKAANARWNRIAEEEADATSMLQACYKQCSDSLSESNESNEQIQRHPRSRSPAIPHADDMKDQDLLLNLMQAGLSKPDAQALIAEFPGKPAGYLKRVIDSRRAETNGGRRDSANDRAIAKLRENGAIQ